MLKFFRLYMKYILAVFVAMLMVAFLVEPTLRMFGPDPAGEVIGTLDGREITLGDQRQAGTQLQVLEQISPVLLQFGAVGSGQGRALRWMLMLHEAQAMGLSASQAQVDQLLATVGLGSTRIDAVAGRIGVSVETVRRVLKNWLTVQSYKELIDGVVHLPIAQRLDHWEAAGRFMRMGYYQGAAVEIESALHGAPRLSEPLLQRFVYDHQAKAKITATAVSSDRYLSRVESPDQSALVDLFDQYKDSLPGQGQPFALGYRIPDRVKIQYLAVPFNRVREEVSVEEADALNYYDSHLDQYRSAPPATQPAPDSPGDDQPIKPYPEVRHEIIEKLKDQRAAQMGDRIIKAAQAMLLEDARQFGQRDGYRIIPDDWQPVGLDQVAQRLEQKFGVRPDVYRYDDSWQTASQLAQLPQIGRSRVALGEQSESFLRYVLSEKQLLDPESNHPLGSLRLQARLPSVPLNSPDGGRCLFRLIDAQSSRVPDSLDQVRDQVQRDARQIAAYKLLKEDLSALLQQARDEGLVPWASKEGLAVHQPPMFAKRQPGLGGRWLVPDLPGLGRSQVLVDAIFDWVDRVLDRTLDQTEPFTSPVAIQSAPEPERIGAIAIDQGMKLVLFRVDQLQPISKNEYQRMAQSPQLGAWINQSLTGQGPQGSLTIEVLSNRVGFEPADSGDDPSGTAAGKGGPVDTDDDPLPG